MPTKLNIPPDKVNRDGRPKGSRNFITEFRDHFSKKDIDGFMIAIKKVIETSKNEKNRLAALFYVLDQYYGKAKQKNELTGLDGQELKITITDFAANNGK